jgi:MYXO-CTERM domain-containing protein
VLGTANPNLAGRAAGYTCCTGDSAPAQAPVEALGLGFVAGDHLQFFVNGRVSFTPSVPPGNNPDGDSSGSMTNYGDGISAPLNVRFNALYGVFLTPASPTGEPTPAQLNFAGGLNFATLAPGVGQIFFIGDGLTSDTNASDFSGARQEFIVPIGATRLFLGTGDGFGWWNNSGSFDVTIAIASARVSEPSGSWLALLALGLLLALTRRRQG